jgi:ADP-ribose pyrophosphatase YjhB (NUDIX family)
MNDDIAPKIWVGGICIKEAQVLLVHRINNESTFNKEYFVFPGKEVEGDEAIESALVEAFNDFSMSIKLGDLLYSKDDDVDDQEYYYLCKHTYGEPAVAPGSNEEKEMEEGKQVYIPMWVPLSELDDLIIYPESVKMRLLEVLED